MCLLLGHTLHSFEALQCSYTLKCAQKIRSVAHLVSGLLTLGPWVPGGFTNQVMGSQPLFPSHIVTWEVPAMWERVPKGSQYGKGQELLIWSSILYMKTASASEEGERIFVAGSCGIVCLQGKFLSNPLIARMWFMSCGVRVLL